MLIGLLGSRSAAAHLLGTGAFALYEGDGATLPEVMRLAADNGLGVLYLQPPDRAAVRAAGGWVLHILDTADAVERAEDGDGYTHDVFVDVSEGQDIADVVMPLMRIMCEREREGETLQ